MECKTDFIRKALGGLALSLAFVSCSSGYSVLAEYQPSRISCIDRSTPEMVREVEHNFIRVEEGEPGVDIWHSSPQMRQWEYELMQSSKKLADSGNPYGMGFFGDAMQSELKLTHLKEKYVFDPKEAAYVVLPESVHANMVAALSYIYTAINAKGDPEERAQWVIDKIRHPAAVDGSSAPDYVRIPEAWFEEAKKNAEAWKANCNK